MAAHSSVLAWRIPMDKGAWQTKAQRVTKSWIQLKWLTTHECIFIYVCYISYTQTHTHTRFSVGFGSRDYRGWEVPPSAICKLDNQKNLWHNSVQVQSPWAPKSEDRRWWMSQLKQMELKEHSPCIFLFSPGPPQIRWWQSLMRTHIGEDNILYSVHQFKCRSLSKTPSQTHSSITFCQLSGHPWIQTSWHIKLTITFSNCFGGWEREAVGNLYWKFLHQVETWTGNSHIPF